MAYEGGKKQNVRKKEIKAESAGEKYIWQEMKGGVL